MNPYVISAAILIGSWALGWTLDAYGVMESHALFWLLGALPCWISGTIFGAAK